jgi:two-component system, NarL family, sensor histidine kinase UhpB
MAGLPDHFGKSSQSSINTAFRWESVRDRGILDGMSLRVRLIALVTAALAIGLVMGGAVTLINASRSVRNEMRSALLVGRQTVENVIREIEGSPDPRRELDDLAASFKGSRHLRVSVIVGDTAEIVQPADDKSPFGRVPGWFVRMIAVAPAAFRAPVTIDGKPFANIVIETDPRNEILEVWNELSGSLIVLVLISSGIIPLIFFFIGRALRPLGRLTQAMEQVGRGEYRIRVSNRLMPELARLRDSFNRMAARLEAANDDNRRLNEQLLTLQEEERSEIARDLHDEIGPFLFAISVDAATIGKLVNEDRAAEVPAHSQSIVEAVRHLQRQVRGMLGRLWPVGVAEFGLSEAVGSLVGFWQRRHPEIIYRATVAPDCEGLGSRIATTIYRIVQECLSNAVRHGNPAEIVVSIGRDPACDEIVVVVVDDGSGLCEAPGVGYGLIGMEERLRAMGGRLDFRNRPVGGFALTASVPCPELRQPAVAASSKAAI